MQSADVILIRSDLSLWVIENSMLWEAARLDGSATAAAFAAAEVVMRRQCSRRRHH